MQDVRDDHFSYTLVHAIHHYLWEYLNPVEDVKELALAALRSARSDQLRGRANFFRIFLSG